MISLHSAHDGIRHTGGLQRLFLSAYVDTAGPVSDSLVGGVLSPGTVLFRVADKNLGETQQRGRDGA